MHNLYFSLNRVIASLLCSNDGASAEHNGGFVGAVKLLDEQVTRGLSKGLHSAHSNDVIAFHIFEVLNDSSLA